MPQFYAPSFLFLLRIALLLSVSVTLGVMLGRLNREVLKTTTPLLLSIRIGIALAFTTDAFLLLLLASRILPRLIFRADTLIQSQISIFLIAILVIILIVLFLVRPSVFPEDTGILLSADKSQQRKLTFCLTGVMTVSFLFAFWMWFVLTILSDCSLVKQVLLFCLSLFTWITLLVCSHFSIHAVYERLEIIINKQYQSELQNFIQVIRSQRHDFNFHMQTVASLIRQKKYDECDQYIHTMVRHVEQFNSIMPLDNPANSALLNAFFELAATKEIRLEFEILNPLAKLPCTPYELNTLLGNLLQNAIDEVEQHDVNDRWIHLLIIKRSRSHIIKVSNPCKKSPEEFSDVFHPGYTTKQSHEGIGLVTVWRILHRFGGTIHLEHEPGIVHFIAVLPIQM